MAARNAASSASSICSVPRFRARCRAMCAS